MEEQELAERCRQGDNLARKELYERYAGRMLSVCLRYAGDRETAQDLMHDGFLKLFDSFDKFMPRQSGNIPEKGRHVSQIGMMLLMRWKNILKLCRQNGKRSYS